MKFGIKIVVALAVVVALGFGVWAFFFKEKEEMSGYNRVLEIIEYKISLDMDNKINDFRGNNKLGKSGDVEISDQNDYGKKILTMKERMFSDEIIVGKDDNENVTYKHLSYFELDKYIDEILNFYLPYMQTTFIQGNYADGVTKAVNTYKENAKILLDEISFLESQQSKIDLTDKVDKQMESLSNMYSSLLDKYRSYISSGVDLIFEVEEYIHIGIYDNEFIYDERTILYDCFARSLKYASTADKIANNDLSDETEGLNDLYYIIDKIDAIKDGEKNIYENKTYSKYEFVSGYSDLVKNHSKSLDYALTTSNFNKNKIINQDTEILSEIHVDARLQIFVILDILGYKEAI